MKRILDAITERIRAEEGAGFDQFDAASQEPGSRPPPIDVLPLLAQGFFLIAEIKRGSPSHGGPFRGDFDAPALGRIYEKNGAAAISVVTERHFFFGRKDDLPSVKERVGIPVLRKDFLLHPSQIHESFRLGADFILLIAACLLPAEMEEMMRTADSLRMRALVEVHDRRELETVQKLRPALLGINNRNLQDMSVDWRRSLELRRHVPPDIPVICESGIHSAEQIRILKESGFAGALVGEHLICNSDPGLALRELLDG